ncbi:uncharacterized protein LOC112177483 [Rosa chinensis]|uniref:uncharacterized protein LOC112177483 n=1 Tax=Rosa chinensis TaxID=74649 RepID=UPI000D093AAE|nr:uncharacterized protein LOC112177483 [Rosa chinensis]
MSSIDAVTASFATSLALAGNDFVDITKKEGGAQRRATQSYLLAKPLAPKPVLNDLRQLFRRIWVLEAGFRIQQRAEDRFLISFDLRQDRNKVLRGCPWRYQKAPAILHIFDGVSPIHQLPMTDLFFWVRITNVPSDFEERHTIRNIASVAGKFLELDDKLFNATRRIRVRVSHDISKPFHFKKTLKLETNVIAEISFFFENLGSKCDVCHLIFHENGLCPLAAQVAPAPPVEKTPDITCPLLGFANQIVNGTFTFQGVTTPILPPVSRMLFGPKEQIRKPIIILCMCYAPRTLGIAATRS